MEFEKLGSFYLGKHYDVESGTLLDQLLMYDARDLTTHAVCVGMTGSGKTGLCIDLLEEAAIDRVPSIIIDPKGDITNLLLQFPELRPEDFRPWINSDDARRKGQSMDQFASSQAELWRNGLAQWGQDGGRIRNLAESADFRIYTPGSDAGIGVSLLQSFAAPLLDWGSDAEVIRERIQGTVSALLGLIGVDADPVKSREHILLSNIFEHYWKNGEDLDLRKLILSIQTPPMRQLGVFEVDTFFPPNDRFGLAMTLNSLIASPSFASWLEGEPLDVPTFLASDSGKPRHSIFYLAHLNESERVFFVTMLLNQVISWMRAQPGTTSLRAIVYMDEIFGFFPPVANPPSKRPMLTLLKQARAYGVGLLLATQNPIDLDYKGLTNAGTWFIGRLQTDRDKARVLDGLQSASGGGMDRGELDRLISNLGKRVFLLHNVNEDAPATFQTRWAMSYLRGPLTRQQIGELMKDRVESGRTLTDAPAPAVQPTAAVTPAEATALDRYSDTPPNLGPSIRQVYFPVRKPAASALLDRESRHAGSTAGLNPTLIYRSAAYATGRVHFVDRRKRIEECQELRLLVELPTESRLVAWDEATELDRSVAEQYAPGPEAFFDELPEMANEAKEWGALEKDLADHLYRSRSLLLLYSPVLKEYSQVGENERDFRLRLSQLAREERDDEVDKLNDKYERRLQKLQDQLKRAELALLKKEETAEARNRELLVSVGESVLGMFLGRRSLRGASSSLGKYRMKSTAKIAVQEAEEKVEAIQREVEALEGELKEQVAEITTRWDEVLSQFDQVPISPRRSDVEVDAVALAWVPYWMLSAEGSTGREEIVPAF